MSCPFTETITCRNHAFWPDDPDEPNSTAMVRPRSVGVSATQLESWNFMNTVRGIFIQPAYELPFGLEQYA